MGSLFGGATQILSKSSSAFFFLNPNSKLSLYKPSKSPRLLRTFGIMAAADAFVKGSVHPIGVAVIILGRPPSSERHEPRYGCEIQELSG
ncbi:hypothetical protein ACFX11_026635 [Malus domestica]